MTNTYGNNDRLTERINRCRDPQAALAILTAVLTGYKSTSKQPCSDADFYGGNNLRLARHFLSMEHGEEVLSIVETMKKGGKSA